MKIRTVFVVLLIHYFLLFTIFPAIGETEVKSVKSTLLAYLFDDYLQKCQSKCKLSESRSKNIRETAALADLKVKYLNSNKDNLIDQMLETELSMKKYKVYYFLNTRFFNYYASKSNLQQKVIEARLTKP